MLEALLLYKWALMSSLVIAPALALVGAQILARNWTMRALIVGQATSLGTYVGLLLISLLGLVHDSGNPGDDVTHYLFVLLTSVTVAGLLGAATLNLESKLFRHEDPTRSGYTISVYALLIAITTAIMALSPHLESHLASAFTGDLSTASDLESRLTLSFGLGVLGWIWLRWAELAKVAFRKTILLQSKPHFEWLFTGIALFAMALSMHSLGILFVIGSMFVPASIIMAFGKRNSRLMDFRVKLCIVAIVGTFTGFCFSLIVQSVPTTPAIIFFQFALAIFIGRR